MLETNPRGNYSYLRGIAPYSGGVVAHPGYEIVHTRFLHPLPLDRGFERVKTFLAAQRRPAQSLCAMELRSPKPFTFTGFAEFNAGYIQVLKDWNIFLEEINPVARTNVAPALGAPAGPSLYGFSFTTPSARKEKTFVVAGAGELPEGSLTPEHVIRRGETSPDAIREKARFVMGLMTSRLNGLQVDWPRVTTAEVYTIFPFHSFAAPEIFRPMGRGNAHGIVWHYARPPIVSIEFEMDLRGCYREIVL